MGRRARGSIAVLLVLLGSAIAVHHVYAEAAVATDATPDADVITAAGAGTAVSEDASQTPVVPEVETEGDQVLPEPVPEAAKAAAAAPKSHTPRAGAQKFEFQAEVSRLMDIIINSLYSNKDIFLRELISNAADALDKVRFLSLTDKAMLGEGDDAKLEIKISVQEENGKQVLMIRDRGIGMTREDLVNNLGTIAKSGTSAFLEQMQKGGDLNLIGQFGVGFYSAYLVADYIEVVSKHNNDTQHIWESGADGAFSISEDKEGEPLGRGTLIKIFLKEEAQEYVQEGKLRDLVSQYSEFINFPIYLLTTKEVEKEVPLTEEELEQQDLDRADKAAALKAEKDKVRAEKEAAGETVDDDEDEDKEEEEEDLPTTKKVPVQETDWEQLNTQNAIWLRDPKDITEGEYEKFYQAISKNSQDVPLAHSHFKAEGDVEFKAILYVPGKSPPDFMDNYYQKKTSVKLYVRRVFISDDFEDLIPRYLRWLVGLVDSDTLPLNVSREMLQAHSSLKTIKKKLVRKALDMIRKVADAQDKVEKEEPTEETTDKELVQRELDRRGYTKLWTEFGKAIKMGIVEDPANRQRLAKLMRFKTTTSEGNLTSLEAYTSRMKKNQKEIFYISGASQEEVESSPFLEKLKRKGYEVIYFTDALDEYVMSNMPEYDGLKFFDASKEDLKIGKDKKEKETFKKVKGEYKELTKWWKEQLGADVQGVKVSKRLHNTPLVVVTSKFGWSANMERIMKAQAMGDAQKAAYMKGQKTLEINPYHPLIQELKTIHENDAQGERTKLLAQLLFDTALLESGFGLNDNKAFNKRVYSLVKDVLKIKKDFEDSAEAEAAESEDAAEEEANPASEDDDDPSDPSDALKDLGIDGLELKKMKSPDEAAADAAGNAGGMSADDVSGVSADAPEVVVDDAKATATGDAAEGTDSPAAAAEEATADVTADAGAEEAVHEEL
mmetsp:Transcript_14050/g.42403  ORF Transcript_14050/g.42403 Transcript_14050/m.42403 type:complete len:949 (-) Transcript_14050:289-3135(-)|eukprot:CAMPEP_0206148804 /NCGR_PEP_ID=MMETSP1473-20131121/37439_1 /ASSEMBLY_ACC=CAM_ASM_001109 /TAXON_ID=1461547 /ORGANISM="Stichococcus sp, Strain RCC1054" /LENGTH=948 /DNA_ID=CAMNT_0053546227 /DNA_START=68 /DNA_END=2914 /DNA_ORIENTATION=+